MPNTVKDANVEQDRHQAALLELALSLAPAGREAGLRAAGASASEIAAVERLMASEPGSKTFLASPLRPVAQLRQQRWCCGAESLVYTPDGPVLAVAS
jgi:hypothetical protein